LYIMSYSVNNCHQEFGSLLTSEPSFLVIKFLNSLPNAFTIPPTLRWVLIFFYIPQWCLNSGPHTCQADALPLELIHQHILNLKREEGLFLQKLIPSQVLVVHAYNHSY
jgi:hypothetical protein